MGEIARRHARKRTMLAGLVVCPRGLVSPVCVLDLSEAGARIRHSGALPSQFVLVIPTRRRAVEVAARWRVGDETGVAFIADDPALADTAAARHVRTRERALWGAVLARRAAEAAGAARP